MKAILKQKNRSDRGLLVRWGGLEPPRLAAHDPKSVSAPFLPYLL